MTRREAKKAQKIWDNFLIELSKLDPVCFIGLVNYFQIDFFKKNSKKQKRGMQLIKEVEESFKNLSLESQIEVLDMMRAANKQTKKEQKRNKKEASKKCRHQ